MSDLEIGKALFATGADEIDTSTKIGLDDEKIFVSSDVGQEGLIIGDDVFGLGLKGEDSEGSRRPVTLAGASSILAGDQIGLRSDTANSGDFVQLGLAYDFDGKLVYSMATTHIDVTAYSEEFESASYLPLTNTYQDVVTGVLVNQYDSESSFTEYIFNVRNDTNQNKTIEFYLTKNNGAPAEVLSRDIGKGATVIITGSDSTSSGDLLVGEEIQLKARSTTGSDLTILADVSSPSTIKISQNASIKNSIQGEVSINGANVLVAGTINKIEDPITKSMPVISQYNEKLPKNLIVENNQEKPVTITGNFYTIDGIQTSIVMYQGESYRFVENSPLTYRVISSHRKQYGNHHTVFVTKESDFPQDANNINLDPTKEYKLSGTVAISKPIIGNNSSISGSERYFDRLIFSKENEDMFTGSVRLKDLWIQCDGIGSKVFNTVGTGVEGVTIDTCYLAYCIDVGILDTIGSVLIDNTMSFECGNGLYCSDVSTIAMRSHYIFDSCTGTQFKADGVCNKFRLMDNAFNVPTGATGLDVTNIDVSTANYANVIENTFAGTGTFVDDESIFEDSKWRVSCRGIKGIYKDELAFGMISGDIGKTIAIPSSNTFVDIDLTTALDDGLRYSMPTNSQLECETEAEFSKIINMEIDCDADQNNRTWAIRLLKDSGSGFVEVITKTKRLTSNGDGIIHFAYPTSLKKGDKVKFQIANTQSSTDIEIDNIVIWVDK